MRDLRAVGEQNTCASRAASASASAFARASAAAASRAALAAASCLLAAAANRRFSSAAAFLAASASAFSRAFSAFNWAFFALPPAPACETITMAPCRILFRKNSPSKIPPPTAPECNSSRLSENSAKSQPKLSNNSAKAEQKLGRVIAPSDAPSSTYGVSPL